MAPIRYSRQAATPKGFLRRIDDMKFDALHDPRQLSKVTHHLRSILGLLTLALTSGAGSMRDVERRSEQAKQPVRERLQLPQRVADNTIGTLVPRLSPLQLRPCLHRMVKAEFERKNLEPDQFPWHVAAIDGKYLTTLSYKQMERLAKAHYKHFHKKTCPDWDEPLTEQQVEHYIKAHHKEVQWWPLKGQRPMGRLCVHRTTLVSCSAAVCLDQMSVEGRTNEIGSICGTLRALHQAYRHTRLRHMLVTVDAGNTSAEAGALIHDLFGGYFMAIKSGQGNIWSKAVEELDIEHRKAQYKVEKSINGKDITYRVWQAALPNGYGEWTSARQVVCVQRLAVADEPDSATVGVRYFVSDKPIEKLKPYQALKLCNMHWRCENEGHWVSDVVFDEDRRRSVGSQHPRGMGVMSMLRMLAQNLVGMLRSLSRYDVGEGKPPFKTVMEHALVVLFWPILESERFDACS